MHSAEDVVNWYDLRDRLRSDFIRCMEEGHFFPRIRQRMLDRVEDVVAQMEHQQRAGASSVPSAPDRPQPHRDAFERRFTDFYTRSVTCHDHTR